MFLYKCGFNFKAQNVCFALFLERVNEPLSSPQKPKEPLARFLAKGTESRTKLENGDLRFSLKTNQGLFFAETKVLSEVPGHIIKRKKNVCIRFNWMKRLLWKCTCSAL